MWRKFDICALILFALTRTAPVLGQENWFGAIEPRHCENYKQISIAFADESLRSPASMFGHTFLVLHNDSQPEIDAMTVEFVGDTSSGGGSENFVMARAFFWSIPGRFLVRRLAYKLMEYGREGRDVRIWRIGRVAGDCRATLENVLAAAHEYSFLRRNCSWHAARLGARLNSDGLMSSANILPVTIPVKTLDGFVAPGRMEDARYRSVRRRAFERFNLLSDGERKALDLSLAGYGGAADIITAPVRHALNEASNVLLNEEPSAEKRRDIFALKKRAFAIAGYGGGSGQGASNIPVRRSIGAISLAALDSPGDWRLNGQIGMKNQKMATAEPLDSGELQIFDFGLRGRGKVVDLERFGLFKLDATMPDSLFIPGFTRLIDLALENHFDQKGRMIQREGGVRFGGGASRRFLGGTISFMAVGTARHFYVLGGRGCSGLGGRLSGRLKWFMPFAAGTRILFQGERFLDRRYPVSSILEANVVHDLTNHTSAHIGFKGVGVLGQSGVTGNGEAGLTISF